MGGCGHLASFHSVQDLGQYSLNKLEFYLFLTKIIIFPFLDGYIIVISLLLCASVPRPIMDSLMQLSWIPFTMFLAVVSVLCRTQCREPILNIYSGNVHYFCREATPFLFAHSLAFILIPNFPARLKIRKSDLILFLLLVLHWHLTEELLRRLCSDVWLKKPSKQKTPCQVHRNS